jgi:hypothetical protein
VNQSHGSIGIVVADAGVRAVAVPTFRPVARRVLRLLEDDAERIAEIADLVLADA